MGTHTPWTINMPKALVAFLLVAVAVAASTDSLVETLPPLEWDTPTRLPENYQLPAPETEFVETFTQKRNSNKQTLHNVQTLKAYALAAYEKADDMKSAHASMSRATLVGLILKYGKPGKKGAIGNIIEDYAKTTGGLRAYFNRGIGKYILEHLDHAIMKGDGAVKVKKNVIGKYVAGFDGNALGFKSSPHYFRKLSVGLSAYQHHRVKVDAASKGADAEAAAAWLMKGAHKKYKSFLAPIKAQVKAKSERLWKKEQAAWKKNKSLKPQVPGGVEGARAEFNRLGKAMKLPTDKEMKAAAARLAAKWRAANKSVAKSAAKVIEKLEDKKKKKSKVEKKKEEKKKAAEAVKEAVKDDKKSGLVGKKEKKAKADRKAEKAAKERNTKELSKREKAEKKAAAAAAAAKAAVEKDKKAKKLVKAKADEKTAKDKARKEKDIKEKGAKEVKDKESKNKERDSKEAKAKKAAAAAKAAEEKAAKKALKEKNAKEGNAKEKTMKEQAMKEKTKKENTAKEKGAKEAEAKAKEKADKKAKREKKSKADEKDAKEKADKVAAEKKKKTEEKAHKKRQAERDDKARAKEQKGKEVSSKARAKEAADKQKAKAEKAAAKERSDKKKAKEAADKNAKERRGKNTCTLKAYEHNDYKGRTLSTHHVCSSKHSFKLPRTG